MKLKLKLRVSFTHLATSEVNIPRYKCQQMKAEILIYRFMFFFDLEPKCVQYAAGTTE